VYALADKGRSKMIPPPEMQEMLTGLTKIAREGKQLSGKPTHS
jgi:hypothetical protein